MTSGTTKIQARLEPAVHVPDAVELSYAHCKQIARKRARNFYYGMKLTPEPKRSAMYAIYAWMRAADDLADANPPAESNDSSPTRGGREKAIDAFRERTLQALEPTAGVPADDTLHAPMWPAVRHTLLTYRIPREFLMAMIDGQLLDQHQTRYASFAELDDYCYKVAGVVGLTCITVWGYTENDPAASGNGARVTTHELAAYRGAALQLTNILRDVVEDARRDRVYLPADELSRFGYRDADEFRDAVLAGLADARFDRVMEFQVARAEKFYADAAPLEARLNPDCRPTCWAITEIYRGLLGKIAADPRRVLRRRVRLSSLRKLRIAMRATVRRKRGG